MIAVPGKKFWAALIPGWKIKNSKKCAAETSGRSFKQKEDAICALFSSHLLTRRAIFSL
jgi:hypothetical protein